MQDFLQDRPTVEPGAPHIVTPPSAAGAGSHGAFARLVREEPGAAPAAQSAAGAVRSPSAAGAPATGSGEHDVRVQPVIENGRVTRIVVTCACGRVTEIACVY